MKKSIQFTALFASLVILFFTACTKEVPTVELAAPAKYKPDVIATDESLEAFNNVMVRFDPLYLQVVFKETKTKEQIQATSKELLIELNKNVANQKAQNELKELYHFESFEALQKASDALIQNAVTLKTIFFNNNEVTTTEQRKAFSEARKTFIINKLTVLEKAKQKSASGLWNDMADEIERQFHYYTLVYNEEFESEMNGGGAECNESCCLEYRACLITAASTYRSNFVQMGASLASSGGALGALYGSIIPFIGTGAVGLGGGILGGVAGFVQAVNIFMKNQEACMYNYKACILRKNGN